MRRSAVKRAQDICFFCALRLRYEPSLPVRTVVTGARAYRTSSQLRRPAGGAAAALRRDEAEDERPVTLRRPITLRRQIPGRFADSRTQSPESRNGSAAFEGDWRCECGHRNTPRRTECSVCLAPKLQDTGFGQLDQHQPRRTDHDRQFGTRGEHAGALQPPQREEKAQWGPRARPAFQQWSNTQPLSNRDHQSPRRSRFGSFMDNIGQEPARQDQTGSYSAPPEPLRQTRYPGVTSGFDAFSQAVNGASGSSRRQPSGDRPQRSPAFASDFPKSSRTPPAVTDAVYFPPMPEHFVPSDASEHRRQGKDTLSPKQRRQQRFVSAEDQGSDTQFGQRNQKGAKKQKRSAAEREMDAIEKEYYGVSDDDQERARPRAEPQRPRLEVPQYITVERLAQSLRIKADDLMERLEEEGFDEPRYDHILDAETSGMFVDLYGYEPVFAAVEESDLVARPPAEDMSILPPRPPIVTIMGHVDHGKTTILDYLRKSSVVAGEHGGITQHIGAFSVVMPGTQRNITFLDTPGHAAFLDMRRRGAVVTDIVVLVVAADDSVKPQTIEAIKHALDAQVQIVVAINKVDKQEADIERVKTDLTRHNIVVEDLGGDYQAIPLSGKTGRGMDKLEEAIVTLADVSDYRAEMDGQAEGWIIESKVTSAGRVATVLVRRGTLRRGDFIVAGNTWARVRTLRNDASELVDAAPPGTPVQIDGWRGEDPTAGLEVLQAEDEAHAKRVVALRERKTESLRTATDMVTINKTKSEDGDARAKVLEWRAEQGLTGKRGGRRIRKQNNEGWVEASDSIGPKKVHFVVKADVAGSVEAIVAAVSAIGNNEVSANVIHSGTGMVSESDIRMLATSGEVAYAISFNQPVDGTMYRLAEAAEVEILDHNVIYKVTDLVKEKVEAEIPPLISQRVLGEADIGKIFEINEKRKKLKVAGCKITNGTISKSQKIRVLRNSEVIYTGMLKSLKNVKKDVTEMRKDSECGMAFADWEDFREGDSVQCFEEFEEKRKLY